MDEEARAARIAELEQEISEAERKLESGILTDDEAHALRNRMQTATMRLALIQRGADS